MKDKFNRFSVPLGLLDYVNPILYTVIMITIIKNTSGTMARPYHTMLRIGAAVSIFFGFIIPTGKVIVGLGLIKFVMPVALVFLVNTGILISGLMLFRYVMAPDAIVFAILTAAAVIFPALMYFKSRKINTVAVLAGAVGYLLIYSSLITLSARKGMALPILLYAFAILLFVMLCGIGIKANLKDPRVHWVIEISNVICQLSAASATVILFAR